MTLGENIRKRREELKLSQEHVAERLGVSRQAISKWEKGQSEPTVNNLIQLANIFEISLSELVDPHENSNEQSDLEKKPDRKKPNPILQKNCNYRTNRISVQLHIGNVSASAAGLSKQRSLSWSAHLFTCVIGT